MSVKKHKDFEEHLHKYGCFKMQKMSKEKRKQAIKEEIRNEEKIEEKRK